MTANTTDFLMITGTFKLIKYSHHSGLLIHLKQNILIVTFCKPEKADVIAASQSFSYVKMIYPPHNPWTHSGEKLQPM